MSYEIGESGDLFDPATKRWVGTMDAAGREQPLLQLSADGQSLVGFLNPDGTEAGALGGDTGGGEITPTGNYLISGGGVAYLSGRSYIVAAGTALINGDIVSWQQTTVTLDAADGTNPRLDAIAIDATSGPVVVTGTAAATPAAPSVDPGTQLQLTLALINAAQAAPAVNVVDVYHENVEWTTSRSGTTNTLASASGPLEGTVSIEGTAVTAGNYFQCQNGSTIDLADNDTLVFTIKSKGTWPATRSLSIQFGQAGTARGQIVTFKDGTFGFNSADTTTEQQIVIPLSLFGANGLAVNRVRFTCAGSGATIGYWVDDIELQGGAALTTDSTRMRWRGLYSATNLYQVNDVVKDAGGSVYAAIAAGVGNTPASATTFWQVVSASGAGTAVWGGITGTLADQADLATYVAAQVATVVDAAPGALDTLNELAAALGDDAAFATTVTNALAAKAPLASPALTGTPTVPTAAPGTDTTQAASTAFVTAAIAAAPGGGSTQGKHEIYIPAAAIRPSISNGAAYANTSETQLNAQDQTYIGFDPTSAEHVQFTLYLPKKVNLSAGITARFLWRHTTTATNFGVVWSIQFVGFRDGDLINTTSWGTAVTVADTGGTLNNQYISAETSAATIGGTLVNGGTHIWARLARVPSDGSDTMGVDADLLGVILSCTTNADTDA
jgi:hypothetical protein